MKNYIKQFEEYVTFGYAFKPGTVSPPAMGAEPLTGYNMVPIAKHIEILTDRMAEEAEKYEKNDNKKQTADDYKSKALQNIQNAIDKKIEDRKKAWKK